MSAIKEVLSRKMFSQGGLLGPEKPKEPTGILASSEPLMRAAKFDKGGISLGAAPSSLDVAARTDNPNDVGFLDPITNTASTAYKAVKDFYSPDPDPEVSKEDIEARLYSQALDYYGGDPTKVKNIPPSFRRFGMQPSEELLLNRKFIPGESPASASDVASAMGSYSDEGRKKLAEADAVEKERVLQNATLGLTSKDPLFSDSDPIKDATEEFFNKSARSDDSNIKKIVKDVAPDTASSLYDPESDDSEPENIALDDKPPEDNLKEKQSLESFLDKVKTEDLTQTDIEELKKKIAAAFDPLEESPTTEGLLLAELGASIMNKGFTKGLVDGLPKITAYHDAQFKAKQKRKDDVSALAVGEFIKDKGLARDLEKDRRQELAKTDSYLLLGSNDDWSNAGYDKITATSSPKYLSARQAKALSEAGVNVVAMEDFNSDIINYFTPGQALADPKFYDNKTTTPYLTEFGIATPINYLVGNIPGVDNNIIDKEKLVLGRAYVQAAQDVQGLKTIVDDVANFNQKDLTGYRSALTKAATAVSGLAGNKTVTDYLNQQLKAVDAGKIGTTSVVEIKKRLLAAQIAPMILGESGKTISDPDRQRVADIIGLGSQDLDGLRKLGADAIFNAFLKEPTALEDTLRVLNESLDRRSRALNDTMDAELTRFGIGWKDTGLTDPNATKTDFKTSSVRKKAQYDVTNR
jgi:hypothetical protein